MSTVNPEKIWFNGKLMPWKEANVHVTSHALHYGSSVFEGLRIYETNNGVCIFRLKEHIERFFNSAKIYRMNIPYTHEEVMQACRDAVSGNALTSGYIRPLAFMGDVGSIALRPPLDAKADLMIAAYDWGAYLGDEALEKGISVGVSSWTRIAPNTLPTAAKAGGNYLSSQLISAEAVRHGYDEGIALDINNNVSEGAVQNLFLIRNKIIYTPAGSCSILSGLTRDTVITLAKKLGYEVREELISRESLYLTDEFFMCGSVTEIVPVSSVDGMTVGVGGRGPITKEIQSAFFGIFEGTTPVPEYWLDSVKRKA